MSNILGNIAYNVEPDKVYFVRKVEALIKIDEEQVYIDPREAKDFKKSKVAPYRKIDGHVRFLLDDQGMNTNCKI